MSERWSVRAGDSPVAKLEVPADSVREREFEISVSMTVRALETARAPFHELKVFADGRLEWQRRIPTQNPAPFDGLDFRFRRRVPVGRPLRLQAAADCTEARRLQLQIDAEEV